MPDRYPGYDVLAKRNTPSWNEATRRAIDCRLAISRDPRFFTEDEYITVAAIAARIVPQPPARPPIPVAALVGARLEGGHTDGYRDSGMPRDGEAWRQGLRALDAEARNAYGARFRDLDAAAQDALLGRMQRGDLYDRAWGSTPPKVFFQRRMARDIVFAYFSHPTAWRDIGWGGPASPRGYVRMGFDERDPWEAAEAKGGDAAAAQRKNNRAG